MTATLEPTTRAEVVSIPIALIDRDPNQPRFQENVDADLSASFKEHGWFESEPLEIRPHPENPDRYMLVDGERRYAGAKAAGLKEALCMLTLEAEGQGEADRLIRQILHNNGKPLTAMEEAIAFKRIVDDRRSGTNGKSDKKYGVVQLARDLGIAKSTATDRLAMMEIPAFWRPFIVKGPLQTSHVPYLHKIREMPEKYQLRVLTRLQDQFQWPVAGGQKDGKRHVKAQERIRVDDFENMLHEALRPFIRPLSDVGASYKGATAKLKDGFGFYAKERVMAIDPSQWEPIQRKKRQEKAAKTRAAGGKEAKDLRAADRYRAQQARYDEQRRREDVKRRQWWKARPQIFGALAEKVGTMSLGELQAALIDTLGVQKESKSVGKLVARGTTADQFIRHLAMCAIADDADYEYGFTEKASKLGKRFGVNVAKLVKVDEQKEEERPDPATTDPGKAGDGLPAVDAEDDDEGDVDG